MAFASGSWQADVQKGAYEEAEILLEAEGVPDFAAEDMISSLSAKARSKEPKPQRKHHYTFDVDDNGLDINGFILHTDKHKGKRHKFRVYLDSNENGRFDKNDQLIGKSGLKKKHAAKGVGNLLDEGELGQLEVKFKTSKKANPLMKEQEPSSGYQIEGQAAINKLGGSAGNVSVMSFSDSDDNQIVSVTPQLGAEAAWGQLHTS